jgi:hypothetical protein
MPFFFGMHSRALQLPAHVCILCRLHNSASACDAGDDMLLLLLLLQGMGLLNKVVLVFDDKDVFWDKEVDFIIHAMPDLSCRW